MADLFSRLMPPEMRARAAMAHMAAQNVGGV